MYIRLYKIKFLFIYVRVIYISCKGLEKSSLFLESYLNLSWLRYEIYLKKIWNKNLDLNINNFLFFFKKLKKKKELKNLNFKFFSKIKNISLNLNFLKVYKILYIFIKKNKYLSFINNIDNFIYQTYQSYIFNNLNLLKTNLNIFNDMIINFNKIKIIKLKKKFLNLNLKNFLPKQYFFSFISLFYYNKILNIEIFNILELGSINFFYLYIINNILFKFKYLINILIYNFYIFFIYIYKLIFVKQNLICNVNKLIQNFKFFKIYFLDNININFYFKESKLELFCIIIFSELFFLCSSFIGFFNKTFDNFYINFMDFIKINSFELFNLLEFMFINIFKKKYYLFNKFLSNLIKNFLNDINIFKLYLIKYYNLNILNLSKSVYLHNYISTIKILISLYNFNKSVNILNNSFELISIVRSLSFYKLNFINSLFDKFYNLFYFFDLIIENLNFIFLVSLEWYEKNNKLIINTDSDIDINLIKPTPFKTKISMEELAEEVKLKMLKSKRSKPRNLTIYQTNSLIELGVLEPEKNLTKKELYKKEWGVSWEFGQNNKEYMKTLSDYISRRQLRRENRLKIKKLVNKEILTNKPFINTIENTFNYNLYYLHNAKALKSSSSSLSIQNFNIFLYFKILNKLKKNKYRNQILVKIYKLKKKKNGKKKKL